MQSVCWELVRTAGTEVRGISWRRGAEARGAKPDFLQIFFLNLGHKNLWHIGPLPDKSMTTRQIL